MGEIVPYNTVNTKIGTNIEFKKESGYSLVLIFFSVGICIYLYLSLLEWRLGMLKFAELEIFALLLILFFHYFWGLVIFPPVKKRIVYEITEKYLIFKRNKEEDKIKLKLIKSVEVLPTLTLGLLGYHNMKVNYGNNNDAFYLYGVPNRDIKKVLHLLSNAISEE